MPTIFIVIAYEPGKHPETLNATFETPLGAQYYIHHKIPGVEKVSTFTTFGGLSSDEEFDACNHCLIARKGVIEYWSYLITNSTPMPMAGGAF